MTAAPLLAQAGALDLPALILAAERLAAGLAPGAHGQRRAGGGEEFWQYRPAAPGEAAAGIDWRRSARSDAAFVRERERMTPQALALAVKAGPGMDWRSAPDLPTKRARGLLLALALAAAALRGGERVAALGRGVHAGRAGLAPLAEALLADGAAAPEALRPHQRLLLIDDLLDDPEPVEAVLARAAAMGLRGVLVQLLDPAEADFPFAGAVMFRMPGAGGARHDTRDAAGLRAAYRLRLDARRARLRDAAGAAGWTLDLASSAEAPAETALRLSLLLAEG